MTTTTFPTKLTTRQIDDLETAVGDRGTVTATTIEWWEDSVQGLVYEDGDRTSSDPAREMLAYCIGSAIDMADEVDLHGGWGTDPANTSRRLTNLAHKLGLTEREMEA